MKTKKIIVEEQPTNKYYIYGGATIFIILVACISIIITRGYYTDKPEDIKHYEEIRDKLTLPQQESLKNVPKSIATQCISQQSNSTTDLNMEEIKFAVTLLQSVFPVLFIVIAIMTISSAINFERKKARINFTQLISALIGTGVAIMVGYTIIQQILAILC